MLFSFSVAGQRMGQSVTWLEDSQKVRGNGCLFMGSLCGEVFQPLLILLLKAVEYGREGHLGLTCNVLTKVMVIIICLCNSFL